MEEGCIGYGTLTKVRMGEQTDCHLIGNNKAQYIQQADHDDTMELHVVETSVSLPRLLHFYFTIVDQNTRKS